MRDEHAVEGIGVMTGQEPCAQSMVHRDRQAAEAFYVKHAPEIRNYLKGIQFPNVDLDSYFPSNRRGNIDSILDAQQNVPRSSGDPVRIAEPPQQT